MKTVIGLDLSLTGTGVAIIEPRWDCTVKSVRTFLVAPKIDDPKSTRDKVLRIDKLAEEIHYAVEAEGCRVGETVWSYAEVAVFVEQYAFAMASTNNASQIMELGGVVKRDLYRSFCIVVEPVNSMTARSLFLGKGKVKKGSKLLVEQALKVLGFEGQNDEGDALVVANYGVSECGGLAIMNVVDAHEALRATVDRSTVKATKAKRRKA